MHLPESSAVDIGVLSRLFSDCTNSYKYLFFLSLLDAVSRRYDSGEAPLEVPTDELAVGMLLHAWYPRVYFRLSFGLQDQIPGILDALALRAPFAARFDWNGREKLKEHLQLNLDAKAQRTLLRYVVSRLLRGFFTDLRGLPDHKVDGAIATLARERFEQSRPLYRLDSTGERAGVILHPHWVRYLRENFAIVSGWAAWEWCRYMVSRNRSVPAVSEKLFPPRERASLERQRAYWLTYLSEGPVMCLYTGLPLDTRAFALDHYLPWKFVLHDQLWNLVPVSGAANSSKSDNLPSVRYDEAYTRLHVDALLATRAKMKPNLWSKSVESYVSDLGLSYDLLRTGDEACLMSAMGTALSGTIGPLSGLARQLGFVAGWEYRG